LLAYLQLDTRFAGSSPAQAPSFRGEVKPSVPFRKILRHVKGPLEVCKRYFVRQNSSFHSPVTPALLLDHSDVMIAIELRWTNQEFSPADIIPP
jgi:hypothetical protein